MRITKLLALATVAVVAVACNGIAPTSPTATVTSDEATALVDATASTAAGHQGSPCRNITEVTLRILRSPLPGYLLVEAAYVTNYAVPVRCPTPPGWSSRPLGRFVPTKDPFVVKVALTTPPSIVQVTAKAPNGVQGSIRVR